MSRVATKTIEIEMAEEVVRAIEPGVTAESVAEDRETIRVRLAGFPGWKLASIIFSRAGLRRLSADPNRRIKVEYLSRDIARAARTRREYRYPRLLGMHS
ncbi:MAG TPA: hypothetical protein VMS56_02605 [Thermoanaerobaculia bacterium]|nr:hypothetical protein [Thermoanaerobaculia bacterium]